MVPNTDLIDNYLKISSKERELLTSYRRPIVLLEKKDSYANSSLSEFIAPGLNNIGIMLPYTGIHYLLFNLIGEKPLVYTSGNPSNIPMGIQNDKIFEQLQDLADVFLLHNRPIYQRADDSVLRIHDDKVKLIRRSRGYVPEYLPLPFKVDVPGALATGPELALTGAILRKNRIFPTQHIGNVTHLETYDFLKDALFHMKNLLQIKDFELKFVACDAHPAFITTNYANELSSKFNMPLYPIQHHHAHVLSLMAENKVVHDEKIVGIAVDGVGYGEDGNVWGGEILLSTYNGYERLGHLEYQPMIGGDRCTKYPARMVTSIFLKNFDMEGAKNIFSILNIEQDLEYKEIELSTMISQFEHSSKAFPSENIPVTSSTGRIFDSISYLLGASNIKTYRGEPAMKLEGLAQKGNANNINLEIDSYKKDGVYIINTSKLLQDVLDLREDPKNMREDIAAKFQEEFGRTFADVAIKVAQENNISKVGLTGGVAYNYSFSKTIKNRILNAGLEFLEHDLIPPGDAGISIGQLIGGLFHYLNENNTIR
jgi:hydrogenase maturation protein HypF